MVVIMFIATQQGEAAIAVWALNRTIDVARPLSVRVSTAY